MVLERIKGIIKKGKYVLKMIMPKHIAITNDGTEKWALKNNIAYEDAYKRLSKRRLNFNFCLL
jgi:undecaprenyl pyrophosphate synthase|tara:strand:+ start:1235 stop:1423 length:189 start_codon:yes stop_codon:yes gene_type:complete